jgi:hypothetical protein
MKSRREAPDVELELAELMPVVVSVAECVASIALGASLALALRWTRARWTWAFLSGVFGGLAGWLAGLAELHVSVGFLVGAVGAGSAASWRARSRGGRRRQAERERVGPAQLLVRLARARRRKSARLRDGRLAIGVGSQGRICEVPFGSERGCHGLILGATDSGKTVSAASIAQATIRTGNAVVAIDPKGDDALETLLEQEATRAGVPVRQWSPTGPCGYNVAKRGGASEVADKVLSGHEWSEPHYLSVALRFVQREVEVLRSCGVDVTLASIARYMDAERLERLAVRSGEDVAERVEDVSSDIPRRMLDDLAGARSRVALLAESEFGSWLGCGGEDENEIELSETIAAGGVAYFRLESDRYEQLGRLMAASLIVDLVTLSAELQGGSLRALLLIDEFASVAAEQVGRLFATARGAGLSALLISQGLADVRAAEGRGEAATLVAQVVQNVSYVLAHRQTDPDAREFLARIAGTYETWALAEQVEGEVLKRRTGDGSRFPTQEFHVHPNEFKTLGCGTAVAIEPGPGRQVERVRIWAPQGVTP